jgi:pilus assembly protein Flp/PilA
MLATLRNVLADEEGATMVEYGVMVALIAAVCIAVVTTLGQKVSNAFSTVNASIYPRQTPAVLRVRAVRTRSKRLHEEHI